MLELLLFALFASRVYQLCGHLHYFCNVPIKPGFQKTRAGHIVMTLYDGLTFVADALLISAHLLFISLAVGHLAVAVLQTLAWDVYCRRFFDVLLARSFYSDGVFALRRAGLLVYDLVGQGLSFSLLAAQLSTRLLLPALLLGVASYLLFTVDLATWRATRRG
jgi:hypothetical protein